MFKVVKPFPYSEDGFTLIDLVAGDERENFGSHADGLVGEGYIEAIDPPIEPVADAATEKPVVTLPTSGAPRGRKGR